MKKFYIKVVNSGRFPKNSKTPITTMGVNFFSLLYLIILVLSFIKGGEYSSLDAEFADDDGESRTNDEKYEASSYLFIIMY